MQRIDKDRDSSCVRRARAASVKSPHPSLLALEPMRASMELLASVGVGPLLRYLPRGDGHPVLVLPAFGTSDGFDAAAAPAAAFDWVLCVWLEDRPNDRRNRHVGSNRGPPPRDHGETWRAGEHHRLESRWHVCARAGAQPSRFGAPAHPAGLPVPVSRTPRRSKPPDVACWDRQGSPNWSSVTYVSTSTNARRSTYR